MNFNKKWLYVVVLSAILVPLIIIFVLSVTDPTKKKEEVKPVKSDEVVLLTEIRDLLKK